MSSPLVFLDIETSGLDPNYHEPIEVAWVDLKGDGIAFSLPFDADRADPKALEVNGFGKRGFSPCITHDAALSKMRVQLQDKVIVANNVAFDVAFLGAYCRRHGYDPPWDYKSVDLKSLFAGRLGVAPNLVSTTSIEEHLRLPMKEEKHTALGDAEWNRRVYKALEMWEGVKS